VGAPRRRTARRQPGESKRDATRRRVLARALALFQKHGVAATTMRDIARSAGLSLGAAYYHFPSKDALLFAYYEDNQDAVDAIAAAATGDVRARLGTVLHAKLSTIAPYRAMLASILPHLVDPRDPLSAFSAQTRAVRERAIASFGDALGDAVPPDVAPLAANALWLLSLALMLVFVGDDSPDQARTHRLADEALDLVTVLLPLLATPPGRALADRVRDMLDSALR
jgi:AcrR family transcriptional regulator